MEDFTMRAARPEDAVVISGLVERAYGPYLAVLGRRPAPMDDDYDRRIDDGQAFVAVVSGTSAGVLVLVDEPGVLLIENVAIDPAFQHAGLGRRMMRWSEEEAARRGLHVLRLYTNEKMARNLSLYERIGYRETHRLEQQGHRRVFMAKRIGAAPGGASQGPAGPRLR